MKYAVMILCFMAMFSQSFAQTGRTVWTKGGHTSAVKHLYFDDAGMLISSGGAQSAPLYTYGGFINDPSIYVWDIFTRNILESYYSGTKPYYIYNTSIEWNSQEVSSMAATNNIVAGAYELKIFSSFSVQQNEDFVGTNIFVFDRSSGFRLDSILIKQDSNVTIALHPFKNEIAYRSGKNIITVRDLVTKETKCTVNVSNPLAVEYSSDGNSFAVASRDSGLSLWNSQSGELLFQTPHESPTYLLHYSKDTKYFIAIDSASNYILWRPDNGVKHVKATEHQAPITGIASIGYNFIFSSLDSTLSFRELPTPLVRFSRKFKSGITSVAIKNDEPTLAVGLDNGDIKITKYDDEVSQLDNRRNFCIFKGRAEGVRFISGDSAILVQYRNTSDNTGNFKAFEVMNGDTLPHILSSGEYRYNVVSPDFRSLVFSRNDSVYIVDIENTSIPRFITTLSSGIPGFANVKLSFSPDSRLLSTSGFGETWTNFWEVETGQFIGRIPKRPGVLSQPRFSADGRFILAEDTTRAGSSVFTAVWSSEDFTLFKSIPIVYDVSATISHDNSKIAVIGDYDSWRVRIWDLDNMQISAELTLDSSRGTIGSYLPNVTQIAFSPDSKYLAIAQKKIYIWDIANKKVAFILENQKASEEFSHIDFSNDGRYLVSAGKSVRLWDLNGITSVENQTPLLKTVDILKVYPNPSSGILTLQFDAFKNIERGEIRIYNSIGILLKTVPTEFLKEMKLDCNELAGGLYFVELSVNSGIIAKTSFIIAQ